jgi:hypothetical protein
MKIVVKLNHELKLQNRLKNYKNLKYFYMNL